MTTSCVEVIKGFFERLSGRFKIFWKQLLCRHEWEAGFHSYHCPKCDKWDLEF